MGRFMFKPAGMEGLTLVEPAAYGDSRGYFMETYQRDEYAAAGIDVAFVQDNQSMSKKGVLRGLHFQKDNPQGKLVRVISGEIFDVAVDIRKGSPTYAKWYGVTLSDENRLQLYVPEGFAHGFLVLSETAVFVYKCTRFYDPSDEYGLRWDDPEINIQWPAEGLSVSLSEKDKKNKTLSETGL